MSKAESAHATPVSQIFDRIWLSIAERRLKPGTRLKEEELAEIFDVSRARIRQALATLEREGLVTIQTNRGAFVSEPSVEEARDVFYARRAIEHRVVERLCARINKDHVARLNAHVAEEREADRLGNRTDIIRLSGGFHLLLAELAGSSFLYGVLKDLISRTSLITAVYRSRHMHNCGPDEHQAIVELIARADCAAAIKAVIEHLDRVECELELEDDKDQSSNLRAALL